MEQEIKNKINLPAHLQVIVDKINKDKKEKISSLGFEV